MSFSLFVATLIKTNIAIHHMRNGDCDGCRLQEVITRLNPTYPNDGAIEVTLPKHGVASMVVLTKDFERLKGLRDWLKFKEM